MPEESYIMAIDEGTTSTRAIIFNKQGKKIAEAQSEITQYFPKPGWVEHNPLEIWDAVLVTMGETFIKSGIQPSQIAAIGITNQRETTVVWDKTTGLPIYNAIVWQSRQTSEIADELKAAGYSDLIHQKTGLVVDPYFSGTKLRWLLDKVPGAQERAEKGELLFGTIDCWLLWKLTGRKVHATDYTNASRTMMFNINNLEWDEEILKLLNIPKAMLPDVKSNSEVYGLTTRGNFYGTAVPIAGMAGDQQAALFGQLAIQKGAVKNTYGTGAFLMMNTGDQFVLSKHHLLTTIGYVINGKVNYALEGSVFVAGSAIQWLKEKVHLINDNDQVKEAIEKATSDDEVYVVPAFTGLGAPYWDSEARGSFFGLTRGTTDYDIIKATVQSLAYQTKDVLETMKTDTKMPILSMKVDGGAARNNYLMQFQADLLKIPLARTKNLESTALGVAFMAGLGVGFWRDLAELEEIFEVGTVFENQMTEEKRQQLYQGWRRALAATQLFAQLDEQPATERMI